MSGNETRGFDVVYQISSDRFLAVLQNLFFDHIPQRLLAVPISVPLGGVLTGVSQAGSFTMPGQPQSPALDITGADAFTLRVTLPVATLELSPVTSGLTTLAGLPPTSIGAPQLTLLLGIRTAPSGNSSPIFVERRGAPTLTGLALPNVSVPVNSTLAAMHAAITDAIIAAMRPRMDGIFPRMTPVTFPASGPCNIRPRTLALKLLGGSAGTRPSLGFFLTLRDGTAGNLAGFTTSGVPADREGTLILANAMLRQLLCCVLSQGTVIGGLGNPNAVPAGDPCCTWPRRTNVTIGGTRFDEAIGLRLCVGNGISFTGQLVQRGTGWRATATFSVNMTLRTQNNTIVPAGAPPSVRVDLSVEWWVWLIAALVVIVLGVAGVIIGALLGGVPGAIAGGVLGVFIGAAIAAALIVPLFGAASLAGSIAGNALGTALGTLQALTVLPADITNTFGRLEILGDPILDDVKVRGRVAVRATRHVTSLAADQVLSFGQRLDFDRGVVLESDDGEGDLTWDVVPQPAALAMPRELPESYDADPLGEAPVEQPARALSTIVARGGARMTLVTNASFESLSELDLERLPYLESLSSIASMWLPVSDAGMPENAAVIAVRTGEGRYAKAAAWRDSAGRLHLRYRTFASTEPLTIAAAWRTNRGAERARAAGMLAYADYEVARAGTFRASGPALREPASYEWFWNGEPLDENGISADGVTLRASGSDAHITTEGGVAARGELAVRVVDATGATYEAFRDVAVAGTERVWETASYAETAAVPAIAIAEEPRMVMVPLVEQLRFAIAAGFDSEAAAIELQ